MIPPRGKELSPRKRIQICELKRQGLTYKNIHFQFPDIKLNTIKKTCRLELQRNEFSQRSRPRSGASRKITEEERDTIYDIVKHQNAHTTYQNCMLHVEADICLRTIQYCCASMGLRKWRQLKRPLLTEKNAAIRLQWAERYRHFTAEDWKRVKFSDETTVTRGQSAGPYWTFNSPQEQLIHNDISPKQRQGSVKKMFWAIFGYNCRSGLLPLDGDPQSPREGVSSWVIACVYEAFLPEFVNEGDIFQHDNASAHQKHCKPVLQRLGIDIMPWPPYSPDLNPIENLWALMKRKIYQQHPELLNAPDTIETLHLLIKAAQEAWMSIDIEILNNLILTMPRRVQALLDAKGWYIKY